MRVRVNPIACEAHGLCAELLPERITLDEWGYPIVDAQPVPPGLVAHARRAAAACPTLALLLERERAAEPAPRQRRPQPLLSDREPDRNRHSR
jgi:ferredoxin